MANDIKKRYRKSIKIFCGYAKVEGIKDDGLGIGSNLALFIAKNYENLEELLKKITRHIKFKDRFIYEPNNDLDYEIITKFLEKCYDFNWIKWTKLKDNKLLIDIQEDKKGIIFLSGRWFEVYLKYLISNVLSQNKDYIGVERNVVIKLKDSSIAEIDIAARLGKKLFIIEAKTTENFKNASKYKKLINTLGIPQKNFVIVFPDNRVKFFEGYFTEDIAIESHRSFFSEWFENA